MEFIHKFNLKENARMALNYLTQMVDPELDYLPYWLISIHVSPPFAKHCRVDDAELVASWYEAITAIRNSFGFKEGEEVQAAFKRHVLKSWGEHGLRFHEKYPWTHSIHSSFHEMAYVLGALNRSIDEDDTLGEEVRKRADELVAGMRKLVIERQTVTFWGGDVPQDPSTWQYEFPNDVYFKDNGWDMTRHTGRGEHAIRDGMMLHSLVRYYELTGNETALDLALGLGRQILGTGRYFNYKREFFGHVHSAVWVATGFALLGQLTDDDHWVEAGKQIFDYVYSLSSSFGWVPEYAQWHPQDEEHCESCCIKDMVQCAIQLTKSGYDEYWDVVNRYVRNQLIENQIKDGTFLADSVDNSIEDTDGSTWKDMDKRVVGGFSGGAEPNTISLSRFRSLAGCCAGTVPQAFALVNDMSVVREGDTVAVNVPMDTETGDAKVTAGYPDDGTVSVEMKKGGNLELFSADWMGELSLFKNDKQIPVMKKGTFVSVPDLKKGDKIELKHPLRTEVREETSRGVNYRVYWRGPDVVKLEPSGIPLRLYVRTEAEQAQVKRMAENLKKSHSVKPTEQKK